MLKGYDIGRLWFKLRPDLATPATIFKNPLRRAMYLQLS
jgi:hypothetical protein